MDTQSPTRSHFPLARRIVAFALSALLCLGCAFGASGCGTGVAGGLGSLIAEGATSFTTSFTPAEVGERPTVEPTSRDRYVNTANAKSATVLVYMVGSDLESDDGAATEDLSEMCQATLGSSVRVLVQAGGCSSWQNDAMVSGCGRYEIKDGSISLIDDLGSLDCLTTDALSDFISWGASYAPADRTELILWDHGGGTSQGFGYEEDNEDSALSLGNMSAAFSQAQVKLDFIGFDACLMGTVEMAYAAREWADYLIASEDSESGYGWSYAGWLTTLAKKPAIDTVDLGREIVSSFLKGSEEDSTADTISSLSVVDLTKIDWLYGVLGDYLGSTKDTLSSDFEKVSTARANAKTFGEDEYDQIDIIDYLDRIGGEDAGRVASSVISVVAYTDKADDVLGANGLAMYYPYKYLDEYQNVSSDLESFGFAGKVKEYFDTFVSDMGGGSLLSSSGGFLSDVFDTLFGSGGDTTLADSADSDNVLPLTDKGDHEALKLTDEQWKSVTYAELEVFLKSGNGYVDLGANDTYETDSDGDLIVDFDRTWFTLNDQIVPFYTEGASGQGDSWYKFGYVPARLNDKKDIDIMIYFDANDKTGKVVGYRAATSDKPGVQGRSYKKFKNGDTIDIVADRYDSEGNFTKSASYGDPITYQGSLTFGSTSLGDKKLQICYMLEDTYGDEYYTEYVDL